MENKEDKSIWKCKECDWSGTEPEEGCDEDIEGRLFAYGICPKCCATLDPFYREEKDKK